SRGRRRRRRSLGGKSLVNRPTQQLHRVAEPVTMRGHFLVRVEILQFGVLQRNRLLRREVLRNVDRGKHVRLEGKFALFQQLRNGDVENEQRRDLDARVEYVAPHWDEIGVVGGRREIPRKDRAGVDNVFRATELTGFGEAHGYGVTQRQR